MDHGSSSEEPSGSRHSHSGGIRRRLHRRRLRRRRRDARGAPGGIWLPACCCSKRAAIRELGRRHSADARSQQPARRLRRARLSRALDREHGHALGLLRPPLRGRRAAEAGPEAIVMEFDGSGRRRALSAGGHARRVHRAQRHDPRLPEQRRLEPARRPHRRPVVARRAHARVLRAPRALRAPPRRTRGEQSGRTTRAAMAGRGGCRRKSRPPRGRQGRQLRNVHPGVGRAALRSPTSPSAMRTGARVSTSQFDPERLACRVRRCDRACGTRR